MASESLAHQEVRNQGAVLLGFGIVVLVLIGPVLPPPIGVRPDQVIAGLLGVIALSFVLSVGGIRPLTRGATIAIVFVGLSGFSTILHLMLEPTATLSIHRVFGLLLGPVLLLSAERLGLYERGFGCGIQYGIVFGMPFVGLLIVAQAYGPQFVVGLTEVAYTSEFRTPFGALVAADGRLARGIGTMESPAAAGSSMIIGVAVALYGLKIWRGPRRVLAILSALICFAGGLASSSSTFFIGAPLVLICFGLLLAIMRGDGRRASYRFAKIGALSVGIFVLSCVALILPSELSLDRFASDTGYQVERILAGDVFASRYDTGAAGRVSAVQRISGSFYLGVGATDSGAIVGDSLVLSLVVIIGLPGAVIFGWLLLRGFWESDFRSQWWTVDGGRYLAGFIGLLAGAGVATLFAPRLGAVLWLSLPVPMTAQRQDRQSAGA